MSGGLEGRGLLVGCWLADVPAGDGDDGEMRPRGAEQLLSCLGHVVHSCSAFQHSGAAPAAAVLPTSVPACPGTLADETLVHSSFKPVPQPDYIIPVEIEVRLGLGKLGLFVKQGVAWNAYLQGMACVSCSFAACAACRSASSCSRGTCLACRGA